MFFLIFTDLLDLPILLGVCFVLFILLIIATILTVLLIRYHRKKKQKLSKQKDSLQLNMQHQFSNQVQWPRSLASFALGIGGENSIINVTSSSNTVNGENAADLTHHSPQQLPVRFYPSKFFTNNYHDRYHDVLHNFNGKELNTDDPQKVLDLTKAQNSQAASPDLAISTVSNDYAVSRSESIATSNQKSQPVSNEDFDLSKRFYNQDELGNDSDNFGQLYGPMRGTPAAKSPLYSNEKPVYQFDTQPIPNMVHSIV